MIGDLQIDITGTATPMRLFGEYRIYTPDPDPWELHVKSVKGVWSTGDWDVLRSAGEVHFMTDIFDVVTGVTTHEIVLTLFYTPPLLDVGDPFSTGMSGSGRTGTNSIHSSIPPSSVVGYSVVKAPSF